MSTALAAVARPRLPSNSEIMESLRTRLPGLTIYNPSDRWIQLEVFGLTHLWACPDLRGAIEAHPTTREPIACDGRTLLRGRFLKQKDSSGKVIEGQDAPAMVQFIVSPERYGAMGFVWLPGISAEEDQKLIELSKGVWLDFQRQQDEAIVSRRAEFKANWLKAPHHKGDPCPPPTRAENAAMDRLQQRKRVAEWRFACPVDDCPGYSSNEWEKFSDHMSLAHGQVGLDRSKFESGTGQQTGAVITTPDPDTLAVEALRGGIADAVQAKEKQRVEVEPEPADADDDEDTPRRKSKR